MKKHEQVQRTQAKNNKNIKLVKQGVRLNQRWDKENKGAN